MKIPTHTHAFGLTRKFNFIVLIGSLFVYIFLYISGILVDLASKLVNFGVVDS